LLWCWQPAQVLKAPLAPLGRLVLLDPLGLLVRKDLKVLKALKVLLARMDRLQS
jgi:hypothetical protein